MTLPREHGTLRGMRDSFPAPAEHPALARLDFWLDESVWQETDPARLTQRLIDLLHDSGIPLLRVSVAVSALHPEIVGVAYIWRRTANRVESQTGDRSVAMSPSIYARSPFRLIIGEGASGIRRRLERADCLDDFDVLADLRDAGATDYVVMATGSVDARGGTINSWTIDRPGGFTTAELVAIAAYNRMLGHVLETISARAAAHDLVDTYVGRRAGARILAGDIVRGRGESLDAAIWLSDIRDFTALSERLPADALLRLLNAHFDMLVGPIQAHGGEVLKLIGDAVLAVFPAADGGARAACAAALAAARDARQAATQHPDAAAAPYALALHYGTVSYGNVGSSNRLDFTVIGPAVNLASRLNGLAKHLGRDILLSETFAASCAAPTESLGRHELRGLAGDHAVFAPQEDAA